MVSFLDKINQLPEENRRYILNSLPYHLGKADNKMALYKLLTSFEFMQEKLNQLGINNLISDYKYSDDESLGVISKALALSDYVLSNDSSQLASHLYGRILNYLPDSCEDLLKQIEKYNLHPWLRPLNNPLTPPSQPLIKTLNCEGIFAITPDGAIVVISNGDNSISIWDVEQGIEFQKLYNHSAAITALCISRNGKFIISGFKDGTIKFHSIATGKQLFSIEAHSTSITGLALTTDGTRFVSLSENAIKFWRFAGMVELVAEQNSNDITCLDITPDDQEVITAGGESIDVWRICSGEKERSVTKHHNDTGLPDAILSISLTSQGNVILSSSQLGKVKIWDKKKGILIGEIPTKGIGGLSNYMRLRSLATRGNDDPIKWEGIRNWLEDNLSKFAVNSVSCTPEFSLAIYHEIEKLVVWDMVNEKELGILTGHSDEINQVIVTSNGKKAYSASKDHTLKIWDLSLVKEFRILDQPKHSKEVRSVDMTPDARFVVSGSKDGFIKIWNGTVGTMNRLSLEYPFVIPFNDKNMVEVYRHPFSSIKISADGRIIAAASEDKRTKVWNIEQHTEIAEIDHVEGLVDLSRDAGVCAYVEVGEETTISVMDLKARQKIKLKGHKDRVCSLSMDAYGTKMISGSADKTIIKWDCAAADQFMVLTGHNDTVTCIKMTPDGSLGVSGSNDLTVKIWDLKAGACLLSLSGHKSKIRDISVTEDGSYAVSVSDDGTLILWDIKNETAVSKYSGDCGFLSCDISADGRYIAVGDGEGNLHFLEVMGVEYSKFTFQDIYDCSFAQSRILTCPICRNEFDALSWLIIDGNERPELLAQAVTETLNYAKCPKCKFTGKVDLPVLVYFKQDIPSYVNKTNVIIPGDNAPSMEELFVESGLHEHLVAVRGQRALEEILLPEIKPISAKKLLNLILENAKKVIAETEETNSDISVFRDVVTMTLKQYSLSILNDLLNPGLKESKSKILLIKDKQVDSTRDLEWSYKIFLTTLFLNSVVVSKPGETVLDFVPKVSKYLHRLEESLAKSSEQQSLIPIHLALETYQELISTSTK